MSILTKDQILNATDLNHVDVEVPEWGGTVRIKMMSGKERDEFETLCQGHYKGTKFDTHGLRATLLAFTLVDDAGGKLFDAAGIDALQAKSGAVLDRLFEKARELNGIGKDVSQVVAKN